MTDTHGSYWTRTAGSYQQPSVIEPPSGQNANNSRHAIWHLARKLTALVYPTENAVWRASNGNAIDDGRFERGQPIEVEFYGTLQPDNDDRGSHTITDAQEGEFHEGSMILHVDSHQPENLLAAASANAVVPDLFPDGFRILGSDHGPTDGRTNFATVVKYRNELWKVKHIMTLYEGGDEQDSPDGAIYRAECKLFRDDTHERNATPAVAAANDQDGWGPVT